MQNKKGHIKVLSTLSLAASDTREDTLTSVLLNTLYEKGALRQDEICKEVESIYDFTPYEEEIAILLEQHSENNKSIEKIDGKYSLTTGQIIKHDELEIILRDQEKARFLNFKNFIVDELQVTIEPSQIKLLWTVFIEFLYNNFYEYGEDALKRFHPHLDGENKSEKDEDFFLNAFAKLKNKKLSTIFRTTVEKFPDYASQEDIDFLNDLALKTISFASLGVDPKISNSTLDKSLIEWVLYLDTNVLYSLLGLHSHPENESCEALIQLIRNNKQHINITLRYSELTKRELNVKRGDFYLLDDKLTDSAIKAMLRTDDLDDFSKQFYEQLLNNRDSTLHPTQVIDFSTELLKKRDVDISRNQRRVEQIGENYLNTRIQDYSRFIELKNEIKQNVCVERKVPFRPIFRSGKQITHDITLREIILHQRAATISKKQETPSLNSVKYFAVTLDQVLMDYDRKQLKDHHNEKSFPIFFKPSFLLNKLVKVLPIKTPDYKKAFLKAVSSRGFNKDVRKSRDILRIVNFLKSKGIDNEDVIYNLISEEIFLEKFKNGQNDPEFDQREFIESELNREFNERESELNQTKDELNQKSKEAKNQSDKSKSLEVKRKSLEEELENYKTALKKLNKNVKKLQNRPPQVITQTSLNFEADAQKKVADQYKRKLKGQIEHEIKQYKEQVFKSWQWEVFWHLFWVIPITALCVIIVLFPFIIPYATIDITTSRVILGLVALFVDGIFIYLLKIRFLDEKNKGEKMNNIPIPRVLQDKLDELEE